MKVKIYTLPTCPHCRDAREFFKKYNVKYTEIDVSKDPDAIEEMQKLSGQSGVPVIAINGTVIVGFDEHSMKDALGLKKK